MNKNGFTLIELIAVVFVILIIGTLVFTSISEKGEKYKDISYAKFEEIIISATQKYISTDEDIINSLKRGEKVTITIDDLVKSKYLDSDNLINPKTYKDINTSDSKVEVTYVDYQYIYNVILQ